MLAKALVHGKNVDTFFGGGFGASTGGPGSAVVSSGFCFCDFAHFFCFCFASVLFLVYRSCKGLFLKSGIGGGSWEIESPSKSDGDLSLNEEGEKNENFLVGSFCSNKKKKKNNAQCTWQKINRSPFFFFDASKQIPIFLLINITNFALNYQTFFPVTIVANNLPPLFR
jgi:hypothetical protein